MQHSDIVGSSTAGRRLACPGSIDLEKQVPNVETTYAAEGTACHMAMEFILEDDLTPEDAEGLTFYGYKMTPERVGLLKYCVQAFDAIVGNALFVTETTYPFPGIDGAFGTGDVSYYDEDDNGVIHTAGLMDWKFGGGVAVRAEGNAQMKFLLCGLRKANPKITRDTVMKGTIVQPRMSYTGTATFTHDELDAFERDLRYAIKTLRHKEDNLAMGPHCQFCSAIVICPMQRSRFTEVARLKDMGNDLGAVLDAAKDLRKLLAEAEKLAHKVLVEGGEVPGYKLVEKLGDRQWIDAAATDLWLGKQGVKAADRRKPPALLSPNQIETKFPELKERIANRWEKPERGFAVAPASDKREAILTGDAASAAFAKALDNIKE